MEVKVNKEIRGYTEGIFFGLTLRQCILCGLGIGSTVGLYFLFRPLNAELASWVCMAGMIPFGAFAFIKYNGLKFEQLLKVYLMSVWIMPRKLVSSPENLYLHIFRQISSEQAKKAKPTKKQEKTAKTGTQNRPHSEENMAHGTQVPIVTDTGEYSHEND